MSNINLSHQERDLLELVWEAETTAIHVRQFAATVLRPLGDAYGTVMDGGVTASVAVTEEGWLVIDLPVMLPRRSEQDRARALAAPLRDAIRSYFLDKPLPKHEACVLVYEHIYDRARPRRRVTDHDNLELKHCQDVLEAAFLTNDSADLCSAFQCSHPGKSDATRIWILTSEQFLEWLKASETYWKIAPKIL